MNKALKTSRVKIDWPYLFLMGLVLLGVFVVAGMLIALIVLFI
jgi:hypothetical protein